MKTIPFRKLSPSELANRGVESGPAYAEYLRERSPMGSVVAINDLRQEGRAQYVARTDPLANTRPRDEEIAEMVEWFKQRRRSQRKRR